MLKFYVKTRDLLGRLREDKDGVVSFEYLIVAFCIVTAVAAVFNGAGAGTIQGALATALANVLAAFAPAT